MKITKLTTYIVPPRWLFLKVETDEGVVGWGEPVVEGRALTVEAAVHELADYLIGKDPMLIEDHWNVMYRGGFYRGGAIHMSALAGIDQALWDIKGKYYKAQVYELLGGAVRDKIRVYGWIGGDRPAEAAEQAVRLACSRPLPVARLGLTWLRSKQPATAEDCGWLLTLGEAEAESLRPEAVAWARTVLGNSPHFQVTWVLEWLDSRHADVRKEGWTWFINEPRACQDVSMWQRLLESPYDDLRLRLVRVLEEHVARHNGVAVDLARLDS